MPPTSASVVELNPAIRAFVESLEQERVWAQVLVERFEGGFRLRHIGDRNTPPEALKVTGIDALRELAMFTREGQFRPLHSAPDLRSGWVCICKTPAELWRALQELYPGSVPDWFAVQQNTQPTSYRDYTNRQSGMYRITQFLSDSQAALVIQACCNASFCLKRRLWSVEGLAQDQAETKSAIPCLEPCAVLLEFARKAVRIEQEEKSNVVLAPSELESLLMAAKALIESGGAGERVGDVASPTNLRRLKLLLEKYSGSMKSSGKPEQG